MRVAFEARCDARRVKFGEETEVRTWVTAGARNLSAR